LTNVAEEVFNRLEISEDERASACITSPVSHSCVMQKMACLMGLIHFIATKKILVAVWRKSRDVGKYFYFILLFYLFLFFFNDISCNITQQLIKTATH